MAEQSAPTETAAQSARIGQNGSAVAELADSTQQERQRSAVIVRTSVIGIVANLLLAGFKAGVGLLTNSIAIVLDAVNNLSDALSSIITIVGTRIANKKPDRKHPYGHGRAEYLSTIIIGVIIIWAGITALQESAARIITPETASYDTVSLAIVAVAVVVKIVLGKYVKGKGEQVNSDTLVASGKDALLDSVISASTLVAALIFIFSGVALEAWLGAIIAAIIIKAGVDILREAISKILGERIDADITLAVKETIRSFPEVHGAYDLVLNDYGPERLRGSVHVEIDEALNATQIAELTRKIQSKVFLEHNVVLTAVGIYSTNVASETAAAMRADIERLVYAHEDVLEMHGFYVNEDTKEGNFDIIVSFDRADREDIYAEICDEVKQHYPEYRFTIFLDADVTD